MKGDIEFFCEDKGRHRRIWLRTPFGGRNAKSPDTGSKARKLDHGIVTLRYQSRITGVRTPHGWLDQTKPTGRELLCPRCGRNPQLSAEKLDLLKAAGLAEVDISLLPF